MKQPIAMRCTKKQFKAIKPKLLEISEIGTLSGAFEEYKYLTNNYRSGGKKIFDFIGNGSLWENEHKNNIHEEWNEKIFLEACGIEVEKTFSITESQIKELAEIYDTYEKDCFLRNLFPEAFESEVKLKRGMWLTRDTLENKWIVYVSDNNEIYGIDMEGEWFNSSRNNNTIDAMLRNKINREATEQEVFEALKNEAVKRGFGDKIFIKRDFGKYFRKQVEINSYESPYEEFRYFMHYGGFENYGVTIFKNGKWAEIIPTITLQEA